MIPGRLILRLVATPDLVRRYGNLIIIIIVRSNAFHTPLPIPPVHANRIFLRRFSKGSERIRLPAERHFEF